jgi:predicted small lipoprotein YifL
MRPACLFLAAGREKLSAPCPQRACHPEPRMNPRRLHLPITLLAALAILAACGHKGEGGAPESLRDAAPAALSKQTAAEPGNGEQAQQRYLALTHRYTIEASPARMRAVIDTHLKRCGELDCLVQRESYVSRVNDVAPSGQLSVRVARKQAATFAAGLAGPDARVLRQLTETEDRTLQVVDVEARIATLQQLRERLRTLMTDPRSGIKELVEIESQLAQTQGELDSLASQRKVLALETDRELFEIDYVAERSAVERSMLGPVSDALLGVGHTVAGSLSALITFVAGALVWVLPAWLLWRLIRSRRRQRDED